jgi:hypothetical protein
MGTTKPVRIRTRFAPGSVWLDRPSTFPRNMTLFTARSAEQSIRLNQASALFFRPHKLSLAVHPAKSDLPPAISSALIPARPFKGM